MANGRTMQYLLLWRDKSIYKASAIYIMTCNYSTILTAHKLMGKCYDNVRIIQNYCKKYKVLHFRSERWLWMGKAHAVMIRGVWGKRHANPDHKSMRHKSWGITTQQETIKKITHHNFLLKIAWTEAVQINGTNWFTFLHYIQTTK